MTATRLIKKIKIWIIDGKQEAKKKKELKIIKVIQAEGSIICKLFLIKLLKWSIFVTFFYIIYI